MEMKYIIAPLVSFVLSLIALVPLVKWRLKSTEDKTKDQGKKLETLTKENHRLELLIRDSENDASTLAMNNMAKALISIAESNDKFQSLIHSQNEVIKKSHETSARAHARIDVLQKETDQNFKEMVKEMVSHKYFDDVVRGLKGLSAP